MKKSILRRIGLVLVEIIVTTAVLMGINIGANGMYLLGLPETEEITSVTVIQGESEQTYTDEESIDLAVHLTGFCRYKPFRHASVPEEAEFTFLYHCADGNKLTLTVGQTTVNWNGKLHVLKGEGQFVKLAAAIFPIAGE